MEDSVEQLNEKHMLLNFMSCFYFDHFKQLDIAWDKYVPFSTLYTRLFSFKSFLSNDLVVFKPDQVRLYMILTAIIGQYADSIEWELDSDGKMIIKHVKLPKEFMSPDKTTKINMESVAEGDSLLVDEAYFAKVHDPNTAIRNLCMTHYGSYMAELTDMHKIINNLIWRVGSLAYE
jgi:hypothetical protein